MGCCVSTHSSLLRKNHTPLRSNNPPPSAKPSENRAPPEEEAVKEVLPETHKWKTRIPNLLDPPKTPHKPHFLKFPELTTNINNNPPSPIKNQQEISEVCSLTESMTSATTIPDKKEDNNETLQRVSSSPSQMRKNRSFSADRREKIVGKSPTRKPEQSPGRRNVGSGRLTPTRERLCRSQTMVNGETRGRDRRSRSPAMRTDGAAARSVVGRSPSKRRPNHSPARGRISTPENGGRRKELAGTEGKWPSSAAANESLENPLVSLECFIFL